MSRQFVPSGSMITCDVAAGEVTEIKGTNSTVTIYGEKWLTAKDNVPNVNFKPFPSCASKCRQSCAVIEGEWETPASDKILSNGKKLLADDSTLKCKIGGEIKLVMQCVGDMADPPNTLDELKESLNGTFKAVVKKIGVLQGGIAGTIAKTVGDIAAPITSLINNESVQNALKTGKDYLDKAQELKNTADGYIDHADSKTEELSTYIEEEVGGAEAIATDIVYDVTNELQRELDDLLNNVEDTINQNLDEIKNGVQGISAAATNPFDPLLNLISETKKEEQIAEENPESALFSIDQDNTDSSVFDQHKIDATNPHSYKLDTSKLDDLKNTLSAQTQEVRNELSAEIAKLEALIEKYSLNNYLQQKIDEELERRIKKAKQESKELQTDIDRASTLLSGLGNEYNAFVKGFSDQLIAKFNSKIDPKLLEAQEKLKEANSNLAVASTGLNGAKFVAGGMPAGLVVTKAKPKKKKGNKGGEKGNKQSLTLSASVNGDNNDTSDSSKEIGKVVVEFRPSSNYDGSYGFDWLRVGGGDPRINDHISYASIVGKYPKNEGSLGEKLIKDQSLFSSHIESRYIADSMTHPINPSDKYYIPTMSLSLNVQATLELMVTFEKPTFPNAITLDYNTSVFNINAPSDNNLVPLINGAITENSSHKIQLEISLFSIFDKVEYIDVKVEEELVGRLKITPYAPAFSQTADIAVIPVRVNLPHTRSGISPSMNAGKLDPNAVGISKRIFGQFFTQLNFIRESAFTLDLRNDAIFNNSYTLDLNSGAYINYISDTDPDGISTTVLGKSFNAYLDELSRKQNPENNNRIKIYVFDVPAKLYGVKPQLGINSNVNIDLNGIAREAINRAVYLFESKEKYVLAHEILHTLGITHTFDSLNNPYALEFKKTLNIMDYSFFDQKNPLFTWIKQWKEANPRMIF